MERVAQGATITLAAAYQTGAGDLVDPTSPTVDIINPSAVTVVTDAVPTRLSLGNYSYDYTPAANAPLGVWRIHWGGTIDGGEAGGDDWFQVVTPGELEIVTAYASLAELKQFVGIPPADVLDDDTLTLALESASSQVDSFCDRTFSADPVPTVRYYLPSDAGALAVDPIATTTGLVVATDDNGDGTFETTWTLDTDFRLDPPNAPAAGRPWTRLVGLGTRTFPRHPYRPGVRVTGAFGWPGGTTPPPVKHATLVQAARLWKRKDAPFGVAGSVEFGSEVRLLAKLDPDVESLLRPYRRMWWVI